MRLLTVTHFFEQHGGGIERVAGHLNRCFVAQGHATLWAAAAEGDLPRPETARPVPMPCFNAIEGVTGLPMPVPGLRGLSRLATAVRESDAVIIHDALYLSSVAAAALARRYRKRVVLIQHIAAIPFSNPLLKGAMALANRLVTRPMLRAAHQVVFISATTRAAFASTTLDPAPLLLFNGVDRAVFHPAATRAATRAALGIGDGVPVQLFVGRFVAKKGLEIIRRAAVAKPDWLVVLAGRGPIDPESWGLPNVRVLRDRSGASLADLYRAADTLLLPSVGEGFPLVVQEAMACGLPVVCGEETSRADPQACRWLQPVDVMPGNPEVSAERLIEAVERMDVGAPARAAMSAYATVAYSWDAMAARVAEAASGQSDSATIRQRAARAASTSLA